MKTTIRRLTTLALALLLCLLPMTVRAESLLGDRLAKAFEAGSAIEIAIGVELDDNLGMLGLLPQESFVLVQKALRAATLRITTAQGNAALPEIGFELHIGEKSIVNGRAWLAEDQLAVTTSLLPGKTLLIDATELFKELQGTEEQLTALGGDLDVLNVSIEKSVAIILDWVTTTEGLASASQEATAATPFQDASVQSLTLRVTPAQLKDLLSKLTEEFTRIEGQTQIISLDATTVEEIEALKPTDNVMEWTLRLDEQDGIAAVEGVVPPMFEGSAAEGVFSYQHFTANSAEFPLTDTSLETHHFMAQVTEENVGSSSISLAVKSDPESPKGSVNILMHQGDPQTTTIIALDHNYTGTHAADREMLESQTSLNVQQTPNSTAPSGDAAAALQDMEATTLFSAVADFSSETRAQGEDGFLCESALGLGIMGIPLGRVRVTLTSSAYAPADTRGNETVKLASLDEAGQAALNEELNAGLEQAITLAMTQSPELLELVMMMQQ